MNQIIVKGIKGYGFHGCMDEEAKIGQLYIVDIMLDTDFKEAAENDKLSLTVDYVELNRIVQEELKIRSRLIESVTYKIAERIKSIDMVHAVEVRVCKPAPPINGDVESVCTIVTL
ncbi:MAG: dihydroneopterin aldolase [Flavobacteriales bacterium]|nr:dihydroneopterin aldolase [Flavobacteriales bacterium]